MNELGPRRIHITGGAGSGKTTLARRLGHVLDARVLELDGWPRALVATMPRPIDFDKLHALRAAEAQRFVEENAMWVCEGSCILPFRVLFDEADLIVWMDVPWTVASYRILTRHAKATLARNNRFPGWRRLYDFWRVSRRFYSNRNPHGFNEWGTPSTHATLSRALAAYEHKLVVCRTGSDVNELLRRFSRVSTGEG